MSPWVSGLQYLPFARSARCWVRVGVPVASRRPIFHWAAFECQRSFASKSAAESPKIKTYRLSGESVARVGCQVTTASGWSLATDIPKQVGGLNAAPEPVELLLAALLGCETATAHFVARHLWPRPYNRIDFIEWCDVQAERDERGAIAMPVTAPAPTGAGLIRVTGVAQITPVGSCITAEDVRTLGEVVEQRCPVAVMLSASGCKLEFEWRLATRPSRRDMWPLRNH